MDKGKIGKQLVLWVSVLLLLLFISYVSFTNTPQDYPPYVSQSPSPTGVKAIYTYLEEEYDTVSNWSEKPSRLSKTNEDELLIMVEPYYVPTDEEMAAYESFMHKGNTILLFSENPVGMFDINIEYGATQPSEDSSYLITGVNGREYQARLTSPVRIQTEEDDQVLFFDEAGALAVNRSIGEGELIVVNSPQWISNGTILDDDHSDLVLALIEEGTKGGQILFDENIHGDSPSFIGVYPKSFLVFMLQGTILALLWLWYKGKRFGPILVAREESVRFSDEGIRALAAWYLRMKRSRFSDSLQIQADYIKHRMQERWGIPYHLDWYEITDELERKWKEMPKSEIQAFLQGLKHVLTKEKLSKQEYVLWSKKLDRLRKGVEQQ